MIKFAIWRWSIYNWLNWSVHIWSKSKINLLYFSLYRMNKNSLPIVNNWDSQISEWDLVPSTRTAQEDGTRLWIFQKFKQWIQDPLGSKKKQAEIKKALETEDEQRWHEYKTQVDIIQSLIQGKQSLDDFVPNYEIEKFQRLHDELTWARIDYQSWFVQILIPLLKNPKFVSLISIIVTTLWPEHAISKWRSAVSAYITNNSEDMHDQYMSDIQDLTIKLSSTNMNDAQKKQLAFLSDIGNKTTGIQETLTQSLASFQDAISLSINHLKDFDELQAHIGTLTWYEKTVEEFLINKPPWAHLSTWRVDLLLKSLHEYRERIHIYHNQTEVEQTRRRILDQIATIHYQYQEFITKELSYYDTQKDQYQTEILRKSDQLSRIDGLTSWDYIATTTIPGLIDLRSTWIKKMSITYHTKKELVDQYYDFVDKIELKGYFTWELKSSSGFQSSIDTMRSQNITYTENTPLDQVIEVTISKMYETYIKNTLIAERNILEQIRSQFMNEIEFFQKFQHEWLSRLNSLQEAYKIQLARATNNNLWSSWNTMRTGKKIPLSTWIQSKDTTPEYDNIPNHQRKEPDTVIDLLMNDIKPASWDKTFVEKPIPINTLWDLITWYCDFATQLWIKTNKDPIFILWTWVDSLFDFGMSIGESMRWNEFMKIDLIVCHPAEFHSWWEGNITSIERSRVLACKMIIYPWFDNLMEFILIILSEWLTIGSCSKYKYWIFVGFDSQLRSKITISCD